jgi:hypothetical protein
VYYQSDGINAGQKFCAVGENPQSMQEKVAWMKANNFGGIMTYDFVSDLDPTKSIASNLRNPLQRAVSDALGHTSTTIITPSGTLTASSTSLAAGGGNVTLTWTSTNATTATIDQGIGTVALSGSTTVAVTSTKTFTLTLTSSTGAAQQYAVTVTVATPAPTGTFTASTASLPAGGGSVTLTWTSANAATASIDQSVGTVAVNGTKTLTVAATTTYTLTLTNSAGVTQKYTTTVTVAVAAPTGTFSSSASTLPAGGGAVTLTWTSTNAATASIDQGVGTVTLSGSKAVTVTTTKTFTLTLTNSAGVQKTYALPITVTASVPAPTATLSVSPASLPYGGGTVTLTWNTTNASSATIDQGVGTVATSGSKTVSVALSTTFKLTATNSAGVTASSSAIVTVASSATTSNSALTVYSDNALVSPWTTTGSYSATFVLNSVEKIFTGTTSIKVTALAWAGVKFRDGSWNAGSTIDPSIYDSLHVALHGGTTGVTLALYCEDATGGMVGNDTLLTLPANTWVVRSIPMKALNATVPFTTLAFQVQKTAATFYIDDLRLIGKVTSGNAATQALSLASGWTMVSSYLQPNTSSLGVLFQSVSGGGSVLKNSNGDVYWPDLNINTIGTWNPLNGYMLYAKTAQSLSFTGTVIDPTQSTISLNAGVNLAPYLRSGTMTPAAAFAGLSDASLVVYDENNKIYWPSHGVGTLTSIVPGHAYAVFVSARKTFTYPANTGVTAEYASDDVQTASSLSKHYPTDAGRSSITSVILFISSTFKDGDEVAVRSVNGTVIGSAVCSKGQAAIVITGDDPITPDVIEGALENEALSIEVWSAVDQSGHSFIPSSTVDPVTNEERSATRVLFNAGTIGIVNGTAPKTVPVSHMLAQNYPNPFNPSTSIRFAVSEQSTVKLTVYDLLGRVVATLVNRVMAPGTYSVDWNAKSEPSGVYFYKLEAGSFTEMKKMIVLK